LTKSEMISKLEIAIHQFAKRQMTWFRGMERRRFPYKLVTIRPPIRFIYRRNIKTTFKIQLGC